VELTADVFEELDTEHQLEFLKSRSNEDAAKVLDRMAPDDAADLLAEFEHGRLGPVLNLMSPPQQHKLRKLLQYHPTTAGGMMNPDYVGVVRGTSAAAALEQVRVDDKAPHQLLGTVFVTEADGRYVGSVGVVDLLRSDPALHVEDEPEAVQCKVSAGADLADVTLMMADYNLTALAVTDAAGYLLGAISVDDLMEALVPDQWRNRVQASSGV
jgi:Mg/Co/Ni transporter MgtE